MLLRIDMILSGETAWYTHPPYGNRHIWAELVSHPARKEKNGYKFGHFWRRIDTPRESVEISKKQQSPKRKKTEKTLI